MKKRLIGILWLICCGAQVYSQAPPSNGEILQLNLHRASGKITLDGNLDEAAWAQADLAGDFFQSFPFDTSKAVLQTEVFVTFDADFLYIGAKVFQDQEDYIIASLKRDFPLGQTDAFMVNIDPFLDKTNGFHFAVSPFNVQREGLITDGRNVSTDWDNKWYSAVQNYPEYWMLEMAIPFKTLRYKRADGQNIWRINFARNAIKQNEASNWNHIPRQFDTNSLAFTGLLIWDEAPPKPGLNVSVIPYVSGRLDQDKELKLPTEYGWNAGGDAKISVTPALNLDLTFNPDFSQVEVDRQITNLSRFELFFPERRQFFLENEDLFARFGFPNSRPFFSRRIGLANGNIRKETTDGQIIEVNRNFSVPILAGARLSGKLDQNWRLGLLNMQTGKVENTSIDPANYAVAVLQRKVLERSYVGAIFSNREQFTDNGQGGYKLDKDGFNRAVGLEFNYFSPDNKTDAELFYHRSIYKGDNTDAQAAALYLGRNTRHWRLFFASQYIGENHRAEMGFIPRPGFWAASPGIRHTLFPRKEWWAKRVISYGVGLDNEFVFNLPGYVLGDRSQSPYFFMEFPGGSSLNAAYSNEYINLFFPFDPTNSGGEKLPEGTSYTTNYFTASYRSDLRKNLYFNISLRNGQYFNGDLLQLDGAFFYRWQPYGSLAISYTYNQIELPAPYSDASFWLIGPRAELSFSRSVFLSAFLQYNTQANNVNINTRLQWRFLPVSDLFLVYSENYFSDQFLENPNSRNRALILKITYWLNI